MCTPLVNGSALLTTANTSMQASRFGYVVVRSPADVCHGEGGLTMTDLEARFEHEMVEKVYRAAGRETGYWAGYFLRSVKRHGGSGAARRLLQQRSVSRGLAKLAALGRLDLAMETLVLDPAYQPLFSEAERAVAMQRLDQARRLTHDAEHPSLPP
jgi:hypothetical protein